VIINLAGGGVGDSRWTDKYKAMILSSRVDSTSLLAKLQLKLSQKVFIAGSAIGWTAKLLIDKWTNYPAGSGFLADVVVGMGKSS
jgi:uncharacterized protein